MDNNPQSLNENKNAIRPHKLSKKTSTDCINAETLKAEREVTKTFKEICDTEMVKDIWKTALIVKLPKKGDLSLSL